MSQISLILGTIATVQALLLGATLVLRRGATGSDRWLASGFFVMAVAIALITASHVGPPAAWLEASEVAATLAAAPLVAIWMTRVSGAPGRSLPPWALVAVFLPAVGWLGLGLADARIASHGAAIRWAVAFQMLGTATAVGIAWARRSRFGADSRRAVVRVLSGLAVFHLAQALRLAAPQRVSQDLVPATGALVLLAVSFIALRAARSPIAAMEPLAASEAGRLLGTLDHLLLDEKLFLEPRLTVAQVARRLGVPVATLSRALNRCLGKSFTERLAELRVEEAERLLRDPRLAHLSVEAIGGRAGFGSRSVFFAEFRGRTGRSPAEFRRTGSTADVPATSANRSAGGGS